MRLRQLIQCFNTELQKTTGIRNGQIWPTGMVMLNGMLSTQRNR